MTTDLVRRFDGPKDNAADDGVADEQDRQSDGRDLRLTVAQRKSQMKPDGREEERDKAFEAAETSANPARSRPKPETSNFALGLAVYET